MNEQHCSELLNAFTKAARQECDDFLSSLDQESLFAAARIILDAEKTNNRLHITGIGKPAHIAAYMASLFSSTGTPTYFLHGTEATHGSCGQLVPGDIVICISNSGETPELKATVGAILNNGSKVIAVTGNTESWLARHASAALFAGVKEEGGPLNRAPRASILAETLVLQALSVVLQAERKLDPKQYVMWHPGGALGQLRENEK